MDNLIPVNIVIGDRSYRIKVTPVDYQDKVEGALKKAQRQASMPGFRAGKVPAARVAASIAAHCVRRYGIVQTV